MKKFNKINNQSPAEAINLIFDQSNIPISKVIHIIWESFFYITDMFGISKYQIQQTCQSKMDFIPHNYFSLFFKNSSKYL